MSKNKKALFSDSVTFRYSNFPIISPTIVLFTDKAFWGYHRLSNFQFSKKRLLLDQKGVHNCVLTMLNDNVIDQQTKHATSVSFILYKILIELNSI